MALTITPNSGQTLNSSRTQISGNFGTIDAAFNKDHVDYSLTNQGLHKTVTFPIATAPTVNLTGFIGLYGANNLAGKPQIWVNNVAPLKQIPMTEGTLANPGYTYLPSGIIMQWASGIVPAKQASITVTLPIKFDGDVLNCQVSPTTGPGSSHSSDFIIYAVKDTTQTITVGRGSTHVNVQVPFNLLVIGY